MQEQRTQDRLVAAIVGWLGVLVILAGLFLPYVENDLAYSENSIVQSDAAGAAVIAGLALLVAWRMYRVFTYRGRPLWIIVVAAFVGINLGLAWSDLTLYPVNPDGSLDMSQPSPGTAGIGLYVIALGVLVTVGAGIGLLRLSDAAEVVEESSRPTPSAGGARPSPQAHPATLNSLHAPDVNPGQEWSGQSMRPGGGEAA